MNQEPETIPNASADAAKTDTMPETAHQNPAAEAPRQESETEEGVDHAVIMGILCYLGPLVLVPYLTDRSDPFIKFHIKQGLVLFGFGILSFLIGSFMPLLLFFAIILAPLLLLFSLFLLVLMIIGIVHVVKKEQKALPVIGGLARKINI